jgi:hypothetical protein
MALAKGTNSYVTAVEADAYFVDRLDVAAWTSADATQKDQSLVTATGILDSLIWTGVAISESQPLAFPRSGYYFDPRLGIQVTLSNTVPDRIQKATKELAYHLLNNDGILDDNGTVTDLSVSSINLSTIRAPELVPATVKRLVKPLLANAGGSSWWRAN